MSTTETNMTIADNHDIPPLPGASSARAASQHGLGGEGRYWKPSQIMPTSSVTPAGSSTT
jgi:hypothetical protein